MPTGYSILRRKMMSLFRHSESIYSLTARAPTPHISLFYYSACGKCIYAHAVERAYHLFWRSHNGEETAAAQPGLHGGRGRLRWLHYFRIYPQAGQKIRSPQPLEQTAAGNGCFSVLVRKILSCRTSRGRCGVSTSTRRPTPAPSRLVGRGRKDGGSKPTS